MALVAAGAGCTPSIGDRCIVSTDCSIRGDRQCDTSQPGGYCTIFNCDKGVCPDQNVCVIYDVRVPGCEYNDRRVSRTARTLCAKRCKKDTDCRDEDGYRCVEPREAPLFAEILDDLAPGDRASDGRDLTKVCVPAPYAELPGGFPQQNVSYMPDAGVCQAGGPIVPPIDAGMTPREDAGSSDAAAPDAASPDAGGDAGSPDGGAPDATVPEGGAPDGGAADGGDDAAASDAGAG